MPVYYVHIPARVRKRIAKIPLFWRHRIFKALIMLETNPLLGEKMRGEYKGFYKVKVWPYRIIYELRGRQLWIEIIEIDHRGNISYA